jgi:hypothetical protein
MRTQRSLPGVDPRQARVSNSEPVRKVLIVALQRQQKCLIVVSYE